MVRRAGLWPLDRVLAEWRPGSADDDWTWDDEELDLLAAPCMCATPIGEDGIEALVDCGTPGHYQLRLEERMREVGGWFDAPALLGPDGRVWDGHHRITAARRLGIRLVLVELV